MEVQQNFFPVPLWHYGVTAVKSTEKFPIVAKCNTVLRNRLCIAAYNWATGTGS